jgi:hypothetical protein
LSLAWHALYHFFLPQFQTRLDPRLRPVALLGHPLDRLIPFRPKEVRTYLGYMSFWMKSLRFLYELLGESVLEDIQDSFDQVCLLYREAGSIYRRCQSTTTTRAGMPLDPFFVAVRLLDPHLHCIPSLHILVICHNQHQFAEILRRRGRLDAGCLPVLRETEAQAVRVTEALLLVRQHSLVDIAPSLFLLAAKYPDFGPKVVGRYVGGLFREWRLPEQAKRSMRACILDGYREMERECAAKKKGGYREVLLRFLARYIPVAEG